MKKQMYVSDINTENIEINDFFVVVKKGVFTSKANTRYMTVELRDKTGTIEGRVWDRVETLSGLFQKNDLVQVRGRIRMYQQKPQLTITDIRKIEEEMGLAEMKDFYPGYEQGTTHLRKEYETLISEIQNPHLLALFKVLEMKGYLMERYSLFPASIGVHHLHMGGLMEHSVSMAKMGKHAATVLGGNRDVIVTGCLLHDIGKVEEIQLHGAFKHSDKGRLLGHIALGVIILETLIKEVENFPQDLADILSHIIVSHHGVEEWGSPKKPMCIEALIVHYLDNLDAKVMGVREHLKNSMENERWSEYHRLYESYFYRLPER
ncbi:MAG: HD domain-containing protein [Syntrophobacterales bacterium]|jgi:3'-5' exoribonuclease|nr:HD domain-containing protein [Syntrophobacterales bacterium]